MRVISLLLAALCFGQVHAQVPREINYQGYLTNASGMPINATMPIVFKLYSVMSGGVELYSETQTVTMTNGVFSVLIGSVTPLTLPFDVPYYLGVTTGADPEMTPRQPLAASPYAIRSASTEALAATATVVGSQITGAISSATLPAANLTGTIGTSSLSATQQLPAAACDINEISKWNGSAWFCAADNDTKAIGAGYSNYFKTTGAYGAGCNGGTNTAQTKWIGVGAGCNGTLLTIATNGNPLLINVSLTGYWTAGAASDFTNANVVVQIKTSTGALVTQEYNQWGSTGRNSTGNSITTALTFTEIATLPAGTHTLELWGKIQNGDSTNPRFNMDAGNGISISVVVLGATN